MCGERGEGGDGATHTKYRIPDCDQQRRDNDACGSGRSGSDPAESGAGEVRGLGLVRLERSAAAAGSHG